MRCSHLKKRLRNDCVIQVLLRLHQNASTESLPPFCFCTVGALECDSFLHCMIMLYTPGFAHGIKCLLRGTSFFKKVFCFKATQSFSQSFNLGKTFPFINLSSKFTRRNYIKTTYFNFCDSTLLKNPTLYLSSTLLAFFFGSSV